MFTDPIFRTALAISLFAHLAVVVPLRFMPEKHERANADVVELNYILIRQPFLAEEEEVYSTGVAPDVRPEQKEEILSPTDQEQSAAIFGGLNEETVRSEPRVLLKEKKIGSGGKDKEAAFLEYYNLIREKIRAEIHSASGKGEGGTVTLMFTLDAAGRLQKIDSAISSDSSAVKQKAIRGVRRAQPFPPFPEELGTLPISFSLIVKFTPV